MSISTLQASSNSTPSVMSVSDQIRILRWAIGVPSPIQPPETATAQDLLRLFKDHRISGRALDRILKDIPDWAEEELVEGLQAQQAENRKMLQDQSVALSTLRKSYIRAEEPLLVLKGVGAFAHTKQDRSLRRTLDIDLVVLDPDPLVRQMKQNGLEEYRNVSPHELINVRLDGAEIDLHAFYPIWSFDRNVGPVALDAFDGVAVRKHSGNLFVAKLGAAEMLEQAHPAEVFGVDGVFVPDPAAAIIIISAHCFRDYISRSSVTARNKPPVRFAEIAEIVDFVHMESFDLRRFTTLVKATRAQHAVEWMAHVVALHAGDRRLRQLVGGLTEGPVVENGAEALYVGTPQAVWTGFWEVLERGDDALCRHISTGELVERLGAGVVALRSGQAVVDLRHIGTPHGLARPATMLIRSTGAVPLSLKIDYRGGRVTLEAEIVCTDPCISRRLHVDVNGQSFEWHWKTGTDKRYWKKSENFPTPELDWTMAGDHYRLRLGFDAPLVPDRHFGECLPLVFAAGEFEEGFDILRGTLLPLIIIP